MSDIITALRAIVAPGSTHHDVRLSRKDIISLLEVVEPVAPAGFELFACKGLHALVDVLDRAERKGYMPDAVAAEWGAFEYRAMLAAPTPVTQPSKTEEQK